MRKVVLVLLLLVTAAAGAQNIGVASFKLLENDLTANTAGTMERDQNGEVAALIKVVTSEQGFVFDGGMTGIVKTKQEVGEVWVYVPYGIKKVTIKHSQLGVLRDYYFPIPIEKAKTYEMVLTTGKVETIVSRTAGKQYVMFNVSPANAIIELDGMPLNVIDGYAEKSVAYGDYDYRVSCANYHTEAGKLTVSSVGKVEKNISLFPNFGWIDFNGVDDSHGAHIYIDNECIGQLPMKSNALKSGVYRVKVHKPLYKPYEQQVTVTDNNTTTLNVSLVSNFANITLVTDTESEIWIDGRQRGKGKCTIGLEEGEYTVEVKLPSHRTVSDVISVSELTDRTIQLSSPTPIYGVLDISSSPSRATVYIDGVEMGQTPLILDNVLVGSRKMILKKDGYETTEQIVSINENVDSKLSVTLKEPIKAVDLGLSVKWGICNVGATSPEDYGDYFAWGETSPKSVYNKSTSVTYGLSISELKSRGIIDADGYLTTAYDAATVNWGGSWRMPTLDEMEELVNNCIWEWTTMNGVNGRKGTGPNGNSIFLPAAGYRSNTSLGSAGSYGYYWSATPYSDSDLAYDLYFISGYYDTGNYSRDVGFPVRPVSAK